MNMLENNAPEINVKKEFHFKPIIGAALILISVGIYMFFVGGLRSDTLEMNSRIAADSLKVNELKEQLKTFKEAEKEFGLSTEVEKFEAKKAVPFGINQDDVIRDLIDIVEKYDIELKSLSFGKGGATKEPGIQALRVNASFEGNYSDLTNFLKGLEQNTRTFQVDTISVQVTTVEITGYQRVSFSLAMNVFYQ